MEKVTDLASATYAALMRDYYLWIGVLTLILAFALYVYFFPTSIDFFENPKKQVNMEAELNRQEPVITPKSEPLVTDRPVAN